MRGPQLYTPARILAALSFACAPALAEEVAIDFETQILPLVATYCMNCHNGIDLKGDLDLERFETLNMVKDATALWQRAAMRVEKFEMPPKKDPQPTKEERDLIVKWANSLKLDNADCQSIASEESVNWYPGFVMSRRLNRFEYQNTIRDLLGVRVDLAQLFPADGAGGEGFDTDGGALFLSAIQIEKYLDAADLAIEAVIPFAETKPMRDFGQYPRRATHIDTPMTADEQKRLAAREALVSAEPGFRRNPREAATVVLTDFLPRAWRRPVTPEEIDRMLALFDKAYERGDGYEASLRLAFKGALVSPHFLFLVEPEPSRAGVYELGDYPLAARLSYFLWGTMPDEELATVAAEGSLRDDAVLTAQVLRMLRDPKSAALGDLFAAQWLGISQLAEITRPDAERYPEFTPDVAAAMRAETSMVFHRIIKNDRTLLEVIDADYTFANEQLAAIYGIDGVTGPEMQLVALADDTRGGVLGMGAILTATSHPLRTSPVLRGKWVLEQLLGDRVPPPPPNVPQLPEDERHFEGKTLREQLEAHRENPDCAGCHSRMDPLGFGLENFDPIGRWRTDQAGLPIDAAGVLPSGQSFSGPAELKQVLLAQKDQFARNLSRKLLGYALGRGLTQYDDCVVDKCVAALQANDYKPSALFTEIALSYPFRHRFGGGPTARPTPATQTDGD
jgi:hypothetical protein